MKALIPVLLIVFVSLSGCASGPAYNDVASSIRPVSAGKGRIYIYRTSAFGAAVQPVVYLNGQVVGNAIAQGFFYVDRPPGTYEVSVTTEVTRKAAFTLNAGDEKFIRLD